MMRSGGSSRPDVSSSVRQSGRSDRPSSEGFRPSTRGSFDAGQSARRSIDSARQRDFSRDGSISRQAQGRGSRSIDEAARSTRSQPNFGRREYQAARPSDDQVRDFLRMRRDGGSRQAQDLRGRAGDTGRSDAGRGDRSFGRGDSGRNLTGDARDATGNRDATGRIDDRARRLGNQGRDALTGRDGDRDRRDLTGRVGDGRERDLTGRVGDRDLGDVTGRVGDGNRGNLQDRIGDATRRGDRGNRGDRDGISRDLGRGDRDIAGGDRDFGRGNRDFDGGRERRIARRDGGRDGDYRRWREGAWDRDGDGNRRGDNRDWSGRWRRGDRFDKAWHVRDNWKNRWGNRWHDHDWDDWNDFPFFVGWWGGNHWHGHHWNHWGHHHHGDPWYWWTWAATPLLFNWFDYGWHTPYYWDYGHGEYIYHDDGVVYVNGQWYQPAPVFYENTVELIEEAPVLTETQAAQVEWLPLGVFGVTREGQAEADLMVQLAVTQEGVIGGTAHDRAKGLTYQVEGTVEKDTQRAVWSYTNDQNQRIIMETSVFNLTQPEATGLAHYGPQDIRVIELVRLEAPEGAGVASEGELPAPPVAQPPAQ
jgi:hypothetical protein